MWKPQAIHSQGWQGKVGGHIGWILAPGEKQGRQVRTTDIDSRQSPNVALRAQETDVRPKDPALRAVSVLGPASTARSWVCEEPAGQTGCLLLQGQ